MARIPKRDKKLTASREIPQNLKPENWIGTDVEIQRSGLPHYIIVIAVVFLALVVTTYIIFVRDDPFSRAQKVTIFCFLFPLAGGIIAGVFSGNL